MAPDFYNGQRLSFAGALCTVRYFGEVKGTKGQWVGVEWDDPTRGKHSGEHEGVRYFECKTSHPTAGSFVRPTRPVDEPVSLLEALHKKYARELSAGASQDGQNVDKPIEISGKTVEEVGFDKIRQQLADLHELRIVVLDGMCISGLSARRGPLNSLEREKEISKIRETCPKIAELDISRNLFERWIDIEGICEGLPLLKSLKVNGNRLNSSGLLDSIVKEGQESPFRNVKELGLEDALCSWDELVSLSLQFHALTNFSLSFNNLSAIGASLPPHSVTTLMLEHNQFQSLDSILPLARLKSLKAIHLRGNSISSIRGEEGATSDPIFGAALSYVDLSYNKIRDWDFVQQLPKIFPGLTGLRVSHNPLYDGHAEDFQGKRLGVEEAFMLTVARLGTLQVLNFSHIDAKERSNAEMYYLSCIAKELSEAPENEELAILQKHPRFEALSKLYGEPSITRNLAVVINPNSLEARLINFHFYLAAQQEETRAKEIPRGFDIYRLKGIVGRLFGIKPLRLRLVLETGEWDPVFRAPDADWDSSDGEEAGDKAAGKRQWVRRDVELEDGTKEVGFWVEGQEAKVRVEVREQ